MADASTSKKRSRVERATYGAADLLEAFAGGKNPHFASANGNMLESDPRIPAQPHKTKTLMDQIAVDDAYEMTARHALERLTKNPDSFTFDYKKLKDGMCSAVVNVKENGRNFIMMSPISSVVASNVRGDVCLENSKGTESVPIPPTDVDTIVKSTNWEIVIGARSLESEETDGAERNAMNFKTLKAFSDTRKLEKQFIRALAQRMVDTYDEDQERCTFLPELMCTDDINNAVSAKDVDATCEALFKGPFVSAVKQAELTSDEKLDLKLKYKNKHGSKPTDAFVRENMSVLPGSDKMTVKTKCFQMQYNGDAVKMDGYTALAKEICEAKKGVKWIKPTISRCDGEGELRMQDTPIEPGDQVSVKFGFSFIVYTVNNAVKCGFRPQWTSELLLYRKRKVNATSGAKPAAKKIKLAVGDTSFNDAVTAQLEGATGAAAPAAVQQDLPELDDYE